MENSKDNSYLNDSGYTRKSYWKHMFFIVCAIFGYFLCWGYYVYHTVIKENQQFKKENQLLKNNRKELINKPEETVYGPPPI